MVALSINVMFVERWKHSGFASWIVNALQINEREINDFFD